MYHLAPDRYTELPLAAGEGGPNEGVGGVDGFCSTEPAPPRRKTGGAGSGKDAKHAAGFNPRYRSIDRLFGLFHRSYTGEGK